MRKIFKKILNINSYKLKYRRLIKKIKTLWLLNKRITYCNVSPVWNIDPKYDISQLQKAETKHIAEIFGFKVMPEQLEWNKDLSSGFQYPMIRFDKIKPSNFSNQGNDIKFPWELSRFTFLSKLSSEYIHDHDNKHYVLFKRLIENWISHNPFLYGVNWLCTMDVAIRAINWLLSFNVFYKFIEEDHDFKKTFSKELVKHAEYIYAFPEIYHNKHTTNHTLADFLGLLFLSVALRNHRKSKRWLKKAIKGLIDCMNYQVYSDGGSFEASTSYQRLVAELFSLGAFVCETNNISLPQKYHEQLFMMFEQINNFCDKEGNYAQFGDNDSGTLFQLHSATISDFSYLTELGKKLFGDSFISKSSALPPVFILLPEITPINILPNSALKIERIKENVYYRETGIAVLKRKKINCSVSVIPIGQNGYGGHNHYDISSFHLSINDHPVIVDPGTYRYNTNYKQRNKFRSYSYHNTIVPEGLSDEQFDLRKNFETKKYFQVLNDRLMENSFEMEFIILNLYRLNRKLTVFDDGLKVVDKYKGKFVTRLCLSPKQKIIEIKSDRVLTDLIQISVNKCKSIETKNYEYSGAYGLKELAVCVIMEAENEINYEIRRIK